MSTKSTQLPVASRTRSKLFEDNQSKILSTSTLVNHVNEAFQLSQKESMANEVLDAETSNILECRHLIMHSNLAIHKHGPIQRLMSSAIYFKAWAKVIKMVNE